MRSLLIVLAVAMCEAFPARDTKLRAAYFEPGAGSFILGGTEANVGEFPWQLSQQRLGGAWSHSCGASLHSARYALSAAHCVDGASVNVLRVIAGLHDRSNEAGSVTSGVSSYKMHERYNLDSQTFSNDIAIITLAQPIMLQGWIGFAPLPANNNVDHTGETCVMSGWGRTSSSNQLPNVLQKASIGVLSQADCNQRMAPVSGANVGPGQICLFDGAMTSGSCNGDSGGPLNCMIGGQRVVSGVTSWGIQSGGSCLPSYPSVYSRTSFYLDWIRTNTP